ncbi:ISL3 family transposase [Methylobacterium sp. NPDC080182]|uniref:ISL3 family transposase n=1 Tax=Methylobacterium sp. NPDC080182 TaxID=3390590 RepID=UPI003D062813
MFDGNSRESVRESLRKHAYHFNVRIVVMDMSTLYRSAVKDVFEWADIVVDKFHVIQLVTNAMDQARIAFTDDLPQPLAAELRQQARIFNKNRFKLTAKQKQLLKDIKAASPQLARAHRLKEKFERIYSYANRIEAEHAFDEWCNFLENTKYSKVNEHFLSVRNTVGKDWRTEIFNYWTHGRFTSAFTESMNANLKRINRYAKGLDFETLRAKAILRYGHYHTSSEIYEHRLPMGLTAQELDETLDARIWKGFSADTLARSLRAGMFEGQPPDLSVRPVVLPDGRNREALEEAEQDEIDAAWDACPGRPKPSPEMEQWYASPYRPNGIRDCTVSYPLPPLRNLSVHDERRRIDPAYAPATHFRGRGRGHGRGRGISLDNLPEHERWARKPRSALSRRERRMLRLEQEVMAGPWPEGEPTVESFDHPSRS